MVVTDPIADLLTRIRNALTAKHGDRNSSRFQRRKLLPTSSLKRDRQKRRNRGKRRQKRYSDRVKYGAKNEKVISNLKRISKPGLRVYCGYEKLPKVLGGLGIAIISTSKGVMTDKAARNNKIGGEVLAYVW